MSLHTSGTGLPFCRAESWQLLDIRYQCLLSTDHRLTLLFLLLFCCSGKFYCFPLMAVPVKRLTPSSRWKWSDDLEVQDGAECRLLFLFIILVSGCWKEDSQSPAVSLPTPPAFPREASHDVRLTLSQHTLPFSLDGGINKQGLTLNITRRLK